MLERDWLRNAVLAGDAGASSSTALHPPGDSGFRRWSDTVAGLRRQALPHGWEMSNAQNYCTVFNGESRAAIVVMAGDPMTGMRIGSPTSRYPKGVATAQRIARNNGQASLFPSMKSNDEVVEEDCVTYVLVQYATEVGVQVELSLPSSMSSSGYVDEWDERILLPMVDPRGTEPDAEVPELENSPSIDFAVSAR
jgi:hypothetical protein